LSTFLAPRCSVAWQLVKECYLHHNTPMSDTQHPIPRIRKWSSLRSGAPRCGTYEYQTNQLIGIDVEVHLLLFGIWFHQFDCHELLRCYYILDYLKVCRCYRLLSLNGTCVYIRQCDKMIEEITMVIAEQFKRSLVFIIALILIELAGSCQGTILRF
jgi:hypothetical protein